MLGACGRQVFQLLCSCLLASVLTRHLSFCSRSGLCICVCLVLEQGAGAIYLCCNPRPDLLLCPGCCECSVRDADWQPIEHLGCSAQVQG